MKKESIIYFDIKHNKISFVLIIVFNIFDDIFFVNISENL